MKAKKYNSFSLAHKVIIISIVGLVVGYIINFNIATRINKQSIEKATEPDKATYINEEAGFMFTYPKEWGEPGRERDFAFQAPIGESRKSEEKEIGTERGVEYTVSFSDARIKIIVSSEDYDTFHPSDGGPIRYGAKATEDMVLARIQSSGNNNLGTEKALKRTKDSFMLVGMDPKNPIPDKIIGYHIVSLPKIKASAVMGEYSILVEKKQEENCVKGKLSPENKNEFCLTQKKADQLQATLASTKPITTESTTNPTVNWKSYSNPMYNFSFKYPANWKIEEIKPKNDYDSFSVSVTSPERSPAQLIFSTRIYGVGGKCDEDVNHEISKSSTEFMGNKVNLFVDGDKSKGVFSKAYLSERDNACPNIAVFDNPKVGGINSETSKRAGFEALTIKYRDNESVVFEAYYNSDEMMTAYKIKSTFKVIK